MDVLLRHFLAPLLALLVGANVELGDAQALATNHDNRSLLPSVLERFEEPLIVPKGDDRNVFINVPDKYEDSRLRGLKLNEISDGILGHSSQEDIPNAQQTERVDVSDVEEPDLGPALALPRHEDFSVMNTCHSKMAHHVINILLDLPSHEKFQSVIAIIRDKLNPYLYTYAVSVANILRNDTRKVLHNSASLFPELYFPGPVIARSRTEALLFQPEDRNPIDIPRDWTATDMDPEHRIAYFREDVGVNHAHWKWHVHNPHNCAPRPVIDKDRRGELFYYFHEQLLARYNFERLSNSLIRVKRLVNWREPVEEAYFSKLNNPFASRPWGSRPSGTRLQNVRRNCSKIDIADVERWRDAVTEAVEMEYALKASGDKVYLNNTQGINILGHMVESSDVSINLPLYGDIHNGLHRLVGYAHDPDFTYMERSGVILPRETAVRDPVFYRLHAFVQDIFEKHKEKFAPYTEEELSFSGVYVHGVEVRTEGKNPNELHTYWQKSEYDIQRGLDFESGPVFVRVTHLQHKLFCYRIQVENTADHARNGTVRIFLAPKYDERQLPFGFNEQRQFFIELDKYHTELLPGNSTIVRWSNESTVTVDPKHTFLNVDRLPSGRTDEKTDKCNCGWPQHMLIPKGTSEGIPATLFVMISDYDEDRVEQHVEPDACWKGYSYCGLQGHLYPDKRPAGFPMDRLPRHKVTEVNDTLENFLTSNMQIADVVVRHSDHTVTPEPSLARQFASVRPEPKAP